MSKPKIDLEQVLLPMALCADAWLDGEVEDEQSERALLHQLIEGTQDDRVR